MCSFVMNSFVKIVMQERYQYNSIECSNDEML